LSSGRCFCSRFLSSFFPQFMLWFCGDVCRHLKGEDLNSLQPRELIAIEEALTNGQTNLRDKQASTSSVGSSLACTGTAKYVRPRSCFWCWFFSMFCCRWSTGGCIRGMYELQTWIQSSCSYNSVDRGVTFFVLFPFDDGSRWVFLEWKYVYKFWYRKTTASDALSDWLQGKMLEDEHKMLSFRMVIPPSG
jgi:hypothetical protein